MRLKGALAAARRGALQTLLPALLLAQPATAQEAPRRVMSLNICTDQLAMLLAAPGQLVSVSFLAADRDLSALHGQAAAYPHNQGLAEEVFLARPDLVVTGTYSLHNTTDLLRRLGHRVEEFDFAQTIDTIPADIRRMGALLGANDRAERMARDFETEVEAARASHCGSDPTILSYGQNGIVSGAGTMIDSIMKAAGFRNLAAELGFTGMTPFPLELLVTEKPDALIVSPPVANAPALADQFVRHPALRALTGTRIGAFIPRGTASCGGPFVLEAIHALKKLRDEIVTCPRPSGTERPAG